MSKDNNIKIIKNSVNKCKKCNLFKSRKNAVFGEGSFNTKIILIGEAPGSNEDIQGIPFVGRAGKILDELLKSINLERKEIFITNIIKCRPPKNRNPLKSEIKKCKNFLNKQIKIIDPEIIVPLGNFATQFIFEKYKIKIEKIGIVHGKKFEIKTNDKKIIIIPVYHPAVSTYNPKTKETLLKDFQIIKKELNCLN